MMMTDKAGCPPSGFASRTNQASAYSLYRQHGMTLVELLLTVAIAAIIIAGLAGVVGQALQTEDATRQRNDLTQQARFAMQRMVAAVQGTRRLLLPLADNPATDWRENVREQTVPASAPEGSSLLATGVLAVTLDPGIDRDADGWADANNDNDYLDLNNNGSRDAGEPERIDEDQGDDMNNDGNPGIVGIDDDGDGVVDESTAQNDDEEGSWEEDIPNGVDEDGDGSEGEDGAADMNQDLKAGLSGIDDDGDGSVDEGHQNDDDEDGVRDEDWFDPVVFYLDGTDLVERLPAQTDVNIDGQVTGADFTESIIATNVGRFRVERIPQGGKRAVLVDITLELSNSNGDPLSLNTRLRVGGGL